ncbi:MAG: hypothetical protein PHU85_13015 [Phycisphaerae bacterium]|nr:hypothetical protein [Phycisphaerae bacterium]
MNRSTVCLCVWLSLASSPLLAAAPTTAPASQPAGAERAAALKAKADSLVFKFLYVGAQDKPFYQVTLSVPDFMLDEPNTFDRTERITAAQAGKIVDLLAAGGWLAAADRVGANWKVADNPKAAGYSLLVTADKIAYAIPLGFDLKMLKLMDAVAAAVDGPAAKAMKLMIGRMSGLRAQWEAANAIGTAQ